MSDTNETIERILASGGAAFPVTMKLANGATYVDAGMMLRDWLAGKALAGMGTWTPLDDKGYARGDVFEAKAQWAYKMADAMLAERNK